MKLITKEVERMAKRYPFYSQEDKGKESIAWLKIFHPSSRYTLFVTEADMENREVYGFVVSALGQDCDEWGYSPLEELESLVVRGLKMERDLWFKPVTIEKAVSGLLGKQHPAFMDDEKTGFFEEDVLIIELPI